MYTMPFKSISLQTQHELNKLHWDSLFIATHKVYVESVATEWLDFEIGIHMFPSGVNMVIGYFIDFNH